MKKVLTLFLTLGLLLTTGLTPANASNCKTEDIESIRELFVPVIRISAHQGRNVEVNHQVRSEILEITKSTESSALRKQLKVLRKLILEGEASQGSVVYWGYREGSVWKTYLAALQLTQKDQC